MRGIGIRAQHVVGDEDVAAAQLAQHLVVAAARHCLGTTEAFKQAAVGCRGVAGIIEGKQIADAGCADIVGSEPATIDIVLLGQ